MKERVSPNFSVLWRNGAQSGNESTAAAAFAGEAVAEATQIGQHDPRSVAENAAVLGLFSTVVRQPDVRCVVVARESRGRDLQESAANVRGQDAAVPVGRLAALSRTDSTDRGAADREHVAATAAAATTTKRRCCGNALRLVGGSSSDRCQEPVARHDGGRRDEFAYLRSLVPGFEIRSVRQNASRVGVLATEQRADLRSDQRSDLRARARQRVAALRQRASPSAAASLPALVPVALSDVSRGAAGADLSTHQENGGATRQRGQRLQQRRRRDQRLRDRQLRQHRRA